jgi:hypothetical protein
MGHLASQRTSVTDALKYDRRDAEDAETAAEKRERE